MKCPIKMSKEAKDSLFSRFEIFFSLKKFFSEKNSFLQSDITRRLDFLFGGWEEAR